MLLLGVFSGTAKTVTFTSNCPAAVQIINTADYSYITIPASGTLTTNLDNSVSVNIQPNTGYQINSVSVNGNSIWGSGSWYISSYDLPEGCTVAIDASEKQPKTLTIVGDPSMVYVSFQYSTYDALTNVNGQWNFNITNEYETTYVYAYEGYMISSIKDQNGNENVYSPTQSCSFYHGSLGQNTVLTVEAYDLAATRTTHVSLEVDGDASVVKVTRNGEYNSIPVADFGDIALNPDTELPLTIEHNYYSSNLYKVAVNGEEVSAQGRSFRLSSLSNGDKIKVTTDFPEVKVPVNFIFANEGTEDAINVTVDGQNVFKDVWSTEGWGVMMGHNLGISTNQTDFNITTLMINGQLVSASSWSDCVRSEDAITVFVSATPIEPYHVTVYYSDPNSFGIYKDWNKTEPYELTGEDCTVLDVKRSNSNLYIQANDGFILDGVYDANDTSLGTSVYVSSDMEIYVYTSEFKRDRTLVFYMDENASWTYANLTLSSNNYDTRKEFNYYSSDSNNPIGPGYSFINFAEQDAPFSVSAYTSASGSAKVYLNGAEVPYRNYSFSMPSEVPDNSVLKLYWGAPAEYTVTYTLDEDAAASVAHDYVEEIENPSVHTVLAGTHSVISVKARTNSPLEVKANSAAVEPDELGRYIVPINADTEISVANGSQTGVEGIEAAAPTSGAVYNLQGIKVLDATEADRINELPAGIYIVGGAKVFIGK